MPLQIPPVSGGNREPEQATQHSLTSSLLTFLDKNLRNFSPGVRDTIGVGILLILVIYFLHGFVGPTYIRGQIWTVDATGERAVAPGWRVEFDNQDTTSNENGYWTLPVRLGGIPGELRVNLSSGLGNYVGTLNVVGPWPIWSAVRPMDYTIYVHLTRPAGSRIEVASLPTLAIPELAPTVSAHVPDDQGQAAGQFTSQSYIYGCQISIDAVKVNSFPGFLRASGRAYFVLYQDDRRVDDDILYNLVEASPDHHFPVQSNKELWIPVDTRAERRYKGLTANILPVVDCSHTTPDVMRIIPKGKLTLKMFADNGELIDTFDLAPLFESPGKVLALAGNETGNATVSFDASAFASVATGPDINLEFSLTAKDSRRAANDPDKINDQGMFAVYVGHDFKQAMRLFQKAAEGGSKEAAQNIGELYEAGLGVRKNVGQARQWYLKAAALGDKDAQKHLTQLGP